MFVVIFQDEYNMNKSYYDKYLSEDTSSIKATNNFIIIDNKHARLYKNNKKCKLVKDYTISLFDWKQKHVIFI